MVRSRWRNADLGATSPLVGQRQGGGWQPALALVLALFLALIALPAAAQEQINSFASAITLLADGTVDVTETIEVNSEGYEIRRGIYRDIPTQLINPDNSRLRSSLHVVGVKRDGRAEPFALENIGSGFKRIRVGDADVFLEDGRHTYTIRYTMTRMGRTFADHDELFWNATGNYWSFPIQKAVASVTLPSGAVIQNLAAYTGPAGSRQSAVTITRESENRAIFRATRALAAGEGMSVVVSFQKGILIAPTGTQAGLWWLSDHRDLVFPALAAMLVLLYNLVAWNAVGRDPKKGTIIPLFHPPSGMSAPLAHYIHRMGWQKNGWTAFTAAIFDLGVRGLVTIDNSTKTLEVTSTGKSAPPDLPPGEKLVNDYFASRGSVRVDTTNGPKLNETRGNFTRLIETENRQAYFKNNAGYVVLGVVLSLVLLGGLIVFDMLDPIMLVLAAGAGIGIGVFAGILSGFWNSPIVSKIILLIWFGIFAANLGAGALNFLSEIRFDGPIIAAASIVLINVVFAVLMRAPTVQGRKLMDQIDGFKMYLETAEKNRLNITGEPPMTVERFEGILPYAIALGVEKPWAEHFEGELSRNAVQGVEGGYSPGFYSGRDWSSGSSNFSNTVSSIATGMSAAMIAAQPSSSSGSGFSGGGGSGGGGGGGGGGGW